MMLEVDIGRYRYVVYPDTKSYNLSPILLETADLMDEIKSYDHVLHQSLDKIYSERCSSSSGQIKKLRRDPRYNDNWKSIINPILEQEPIVSKYFSKEEFGKLSLLWIAIMAGYEKSAELLVRSGADVNETFGRHNPPVIDPRSTVLHVLLQMNPSPENERLIRLVVDYGADLQARDSPRRTVLHYAVIKGRVKMTEMLLKKGAEVNAADNDNKTPLLNALASRSKVHELLLLLIKHGADVFVKCREDHQNALHHLTESSIDATNAVDVARVLIEKGVSLNDKDFVNYSQPLHLAVLRKRNELVKLFLDHGANVNALAMEGKSSLYFAARYAGSERGVIMIETLLKCGANVHLRTKKGRTALHVVCQYSASRYRADFDEKHCEISIRLLLSAGADVVAKDRIGLTPLAFLSSREMEHQPGQESWPLIEVLALKKALEPSIELEDEMIIERYQNLRDYYRKCTDEIDMMKSTRFIDSCSFLELFVKSRCQITLLMRNPDFEIKFMFYDLNGKLPIYAENVRRAFERGKNYYHAMLEQEALINEAVYNILPYLVVRKIVDYIELLQECEIRKVC